MLNYSVEQIKMPSWSLNKEVIEWVTKKHSIKWFVHRDSFKHKLLYWVLSMLYKNNSDIFKNAKINIVCCSAFLRHCLKLFHKAKMSIFYLLNKWITHLSNSIIDWRNGKYRPCFNYWNFHSSNSVKNAYSFEIILWGSHCMIQVIFQKCWFSQHSK